MDRYEEALERANEAVKRGMVSQNFVDDIFGVESEDERIRKNCIHFLKLQKAHHADTSEIDDCIAYLERHIEQKPIQYDIDVLEKHITKDSVSELAHTVIVRNGWEIVEKEQKCHGCFDRDEVFRQGMMKGAKEKEEEMMKDAIPAIVYFDFSDPGDVVCRKLSVNKTALSDALLKLDMNDVQNDGSDVKLIIVKKDEVR